MARINISTGTITQFCSKERPRIFLFRKTSPNSSYRTFARGGYIIRITPTEIGIEVVPTLKWFRKGTIPGRTQPATTPTSMAVKIQSVRYRSRKLRRIVVCIREPPRPTPSAKGIRFLEMQNRLYTSDIVDFFLERETVNAGERKAEKQTDSALEHKKASRKARSTSASVPRTAAGSGTPQWAVMGWPGHTGQTSLAALSQTVKTKSSFGASGRENSSQPLLRRPLVGK